MMTRKKAGLLAGLVLVTMMLAAWSTQPTQSSYKSIITMATADSYFFPKKEYGLQYIDNGDSSQGFTFVQISRYAGSGVGTFVVYSGAFVGTVGKETVRVAGAPYEFSSNYYTLDSIVAVTISAADTFQAEGTN